MRIVLIILSIVILAFIWINSSLPASISKAISMAVQKILGIDSTQHLIRKTGHFSEFLFLGLSLFMLVNLTVKQIKDRVFSVSFLTIFIPLTDETIQLFSQGRSAEVGDIWIDIGGFLLGCIAAAMFILIIKLISNCRSNIRTLEKERTKYGE